MRVRRSAHALIVREGKLLVVREAMGYWSLPGGGARPGEPLLAALEREVWEETGCRVVHPSLLALVEHPMFPNTPHAAWVLSARFEAGLVGEPVPGPDVQKLAWVPLETAAAWLSQGHPHPEVWAQVAAYARGEGRGYFGPAARTS